MTFKLGAFEPMNPMFSKSLNDKLRRFSGDGDLNDPGTLKFIFPAQKRALWPRPTDI